MEQIKINENKLNTSVHFNINSASHSNKDAVLGQIVLELTISNMNGDVQVLKQNCLILRPELELQLVLLGNDFLHSNSVNISNSSSSVQTTISINSELVPLLTDKIKAYSLYPSSFLANSHLSEENTNNLTKSDDSEACVHSESPTETVEEQQNATQFFHLNPDFEMTSINSFLQDCKAAKYKHSNHQDVTSYSVHQTNLDDIVNAEFEKKSIIPDPGSKNPSSKISHLSIPLQK